MGRFPYFWLNRLKFRFGLESPDFHSQRMGDGSAGFACGYRETHYSNGSVAKQSEEAWCQPHAQAQDLTLSGRSADERAGPTSFLYWHTSEAIGTT